MRSTEELVKATQAGDQSAFAQLVRLYERAGIMTAQSVLGDFHAAQDAAQDGFVTAYRKIGQLRDAASFGPWILKIVRRRAVEMQQKTRAPQMTPDTTAAIAAPSNEWIATVEMEVVDQVARLPQHERLVVVLRYIDGHSVAKIAELTGKPLGTVTKQLSRAIQRLRAWLVEVKS